MSDKTDTFVTFGDAEYKSKAEEAMNKIFQGVLHSDPKKTCSNEEKKAMRQCEEAGLEKLAEEIKTTKTS